MIHIIAASYGTIFLSIWSSISFFDFDFVALSARNLIGLYILHNCSTVTHWFLVKFLISIFIPYILIPPYYFHCFISIISLSSL